MVWRERLGMQVEWRRNCRENSPFISLHSIQGWTPARSPTSAGTIPDLKTPIGDFQIRAFRNRIFCLENSAGTKSKLLRDIFGGSALRPR
jgi:hypothetical protein